MRIAMWSGPRNLSTAMMYSFARRSDCWVSDEPFYAAYLAASGIEHPMRVEILARHETDPASIARACAGPIPQGRAVWYQKHMAHHMLDGFPMDWLSEVQSVFLIRHPARVVASYARKREGPALEDLGFLQLAALFERECAAGREPVVIEGESVAAAPEKTLMRLCEALGIGFEPAMLSWPAGGHPADGAWAAHWYGAVHRSTGFREPEEDPPALTGAYAALAEAAMPAYERLSRRALTP